MNAPTNDWDPKALWAAYSPDEKAHWNLRRVVHLHRRAGFGATWAELQRDLKDGVEKSVDRLLQGKSRHGVPENFDTVAEQIREHGGPTGSKSWWMYRMFAGPDPLGERLALLWHNHFATSNEKVGNARWMQKQNTLFCRHGRGPFAELLTAVVHDPAVLVWLDAPANKKGQPNENLAREMMELFTLGVGHYTETDVKEAARALTGWTLTQGGEFRERIADHDDGEKTLLNNKGRWKGDDVVRILLQHPATSRRLAWRICDWLMGEKFVEAAALDALAAGLRQNNLDIGWAVQTVLRSGIFFDERNMGNRVLGPVEFLVGTARALERFDPPASSLLLGEWSARLGQDLFYPPNVGGWAGGREWLTSQAIIGRANFAAALVEGHLSANPVPLDGIALARRCNRGQDLEDVLAFVVELLTGSGPEPAWRKRLLACLGAKPKLEQETVRALIALIVASPETQLA